jgi:cold shock CspA family protein
MRKGIVVSYNSNLGSGYIKDVNHQKIRFLVVPYTLPIKKGNVVAFEIQSVSGRLTAVEIQPIGSLQETHFSFSFYKNGEN